MANHWTGTKDEDRATQLMLERCQTEIKRLQKQIRALLTVIELMGEKDGRAPETEG